MTDQHVDGKIVPPLDLQRALEAAISDVDGVRPHFTQAALQAEAILYSTPMQEYLDRHKPHEPSPEEWRHAIEAERALQIEKGYDHAHDAEHGIEHLLNWAIDYDRRGRTIEASALKRAALDLLQDQKPTEQGQTAAEPREPVKVVCTVTVPLSSPHAAADALSRVPIHATVSYQKDGAGILAGVFGVGALVAQWTEER